jgi:Holliday junction resolvase-like predicted endonuclease
VFLVRHGVEVLARNVRVAAGEIDLIGLVDGRRVLFEVRTTTKWAHPDDLFPERKRRRLRRLAAVTQCSRVDLIWVFLSEHGPRIRWIRGIGSDQAYSTPPPA